MPLTVETGIVNLAVQDLQRSIAFYAEKLGFEVLDRSPDDVVLMRAGDLQIALVPAGQAVRPQATSLLFVVRNINRALREITRAGIEVSEYFPEHNLAQFKDPDGHLLGVLQQQAPASTGTGAVPGGPAAAREDEDGDEDEDDELPPPPF